MTNREMLNKIFKEVFNIDDTTLDDELRDCNLICTQDCADGKCNSCKYKDFWNKEYEEPKVKLNRVVTEELCECFVCGAITTTDDQPCPKCGNYAFLRYPETSLVSDEEYVDYQKIKCLRSGRIATEILMLYFGMPKSMQKAVKDIMLVTQVKGSEDDD